MSYAEIMDKATSLIAVNEANRRGLEYGRRESDRELEALRDNLRLACNLLSKAIRMAEGAEFTEQDMTALKMGLEVINGR